MFVSNSYQANETSILLRSPNIITMETDRKLVVSDVQRQIIAISTMEAPCDTLKSVRVVSSVTCHYFRIAWVRKLWNWWSSDYDPKDSLWLLSVLDIGMQLLTCIWKTVAFQLSFSEWWAFVGTSLTENRKVIANCVQTKDFPVKPALDSRNGSHQ